MWYFSTKKLDFNELHKMFYCARVEILAIFNWSSQS